jgi:hypothetical protein
MMGMSQITVIRFYVDGKISQRRPPHGQEGPGERKKQNSPPNPFAFPWAGRIGVTSSLDCLVLLRLCCVAPAHTKIYQNHDLMTRSDTFPAC